MAKIRFVLVRSENNLPTDNYQEVRAAKSDSGHQSIR